VLDWTANRFWSIAPDWTERLPTPANRRFRRALAALDTAVEGIVAARLAAGDVGDDLLGMLLAAQGEDGSGIDARQVRDEVMTMLVAGHETSAAALTWTWHLLALHPQVAEAVRDGVERVLDGRAVPEAEDLGRLELTRAVMQEAMRLYPPAGIPRLAAGPDRIGGYDIPAGAILILNTEPLVGAARPALLARSGTLRPGAVRTRGATGSLHLLPLWRWAADLHRQPLRDDRDARRAGGAGAKAPVATRLRRPGPTETARHAPSSRRTADAR
jgi:hypothetical protein